MWNMANMPAVYCDIRTVMLAPAGIAARLSRATTLLNGALAAAARDGDDPLLTVLTQVLGAGRLTVGSEASATTSAADARASVSEYPRRLADLGTDGWGVPLGFATLLRDCWEYEEKAAWEWLFLDRPPVLNGFTPIEALQTGKGDDVVALLCKIRDAAIARLREGAQRPAP